MIRNWSNIIWKHKQIYSFFTIFNIDITSTDKCLQHLPDFKYNLFLFRKKKWLKTVMISYFYFFNNLKSWILNFHIINKQIIFNTNTTVVSVNRFFNMMHFDFFSLLKLKFFYLYNFKRKELLILYCVVAQISLVFIFNFKTVVNKLEALATILSNLIILFSYKGAFIDTFSYYICYLILTFRKSYNTVLQNSLTKNNVKSTLVTSFEPNKCTVLDLSSAIMLNFLTLHIIKIIYNYLILITLSNF